MDHSTMRLQPDSFLTCLTIELGFTASHSLPSRPEHHPHFWSVNWRFKAPFPQQMGMHLDLLDLRSRLMPLVQELDGSDLHHHKAFQNLPQPLEALPLYPTSELLAGYFFWRTCQEQASWPSGPLTLSRVTVGLYEEDRSICWGEADVFLQEP